jgi:hypothetical protein
LKLHACIAEHEQQNVISTECVRCDDVYECSPCFQICEQGCQRLVCLSDHLLFLYLNVVKLFIIIMMSLHAHFQIPQFLLDDWLLNWNSGSRSHVEIVCTQPRRLSAIGVAERVAEERAEEIGNTVGYQVMHLILDYSCQFEFTRM